LKRPVEKTHIETDMCRT